MDGEPVAGMTFYGPSRDEIKLRLKSLTQETDGIAI